MQEGFTKDIEQQERLKVNLSRIKNKLIVISGKGGVGKTTVAVNLAYGLAVKGYKVGILDVDMHGPNVAKMLGIEGKRLECSDAGIEPVEVFPTLKAVSVALLIENQDTPIIWRGPLKMITIKQFLSDVNWGDLDYLIVDSPPGTGDEPLTVAQLIKDAKAVIVTTPQEVALGERRGRTDSSGGGEGGVSSSQGHCEEGLQVVLPSGWASVQVLGGRGRRSVRT